MLFPWLRDLLGRTSTNAKKLMRRRHSRWQRCRLALEVLEDRVVPAATWTALTNLAPSGAGVMLLLPDGRVMVQGGGVAKTWSQLVPNSSGSYIDGTWSALASMGLERLYFGSNVLPSGKVFIVGGEYSGPSGTNNWTNTGEIYDPVANSWSPILNFPKTQFGDDPTEVLNTGKVLAGYLSGAQTYLYDPAANTWTATGTKLRSDRSDEESWVILPDGSILSYDIFSSISLGVGHAQRYVPSTGTWVDTATVPVALSSAALGDELGPAFLLPDGRVFQIGANSNTALYTPATDTTPDSWAAGPVIPNGKGADDAPGAMLPNGHVIFAADTPKFNAPTQLFDFDPVANTITQVTLPAALTTALNADKAFVTRMLMLPTGDMLLSTSGKQLWDFAPDGSPDASWQPTISSIALNTDSSFTLTGTQLNGRSEGAAYGDDAEMSSNYPIVKLTSAGGTVTYARTFNWTSQVATGSTPVTTQFTLPAGLPAGAYSLTVIANGIASSNVLFVNMGTGANNVALRVNPGNSSQVQVLQSAGVIGTFAAGSFSAVYAAGDTGNDALTVDNSFGDPLPAGGLNYDGGLGTGVDSLAIVNGSWTTNTYTYTGAHDGGINLDGKLITYSRLAPISNSGIAANIVFNLPAGANDAFLEDDGILSNNTSRLRSNAGGFETTTFAHATGSLTIHGSGAGDKLTVTPADSLGAANVSADTEDNIVAGSLTTIGSLTLTATATATSAINDDGSQTTALAAATINLTANGSIGGAGTNDIDLASTTLTTSSGNSQFLNETGTASVNSLSAGTQALTLTGGVFNLSNSNGINNNTQFIVNSPAQFHLNGFNETVGLLAGDGSVDLGAKTLTVGGLNIASAFSGAISGTGGKLIKAGAASLTLSGTDGYTGATSVNSGTLLVNGSLTASAVTVASTATLGGSGTVGGTVLVNSGGFLAPGNSPGSLITGTVTFSAGSTFTVEVNGPTAGMQYDQLIVNGDVTLGGATLSASGTIPSLHDQVITLVKNNGTNPVSGTFSGRAEGSTVTLNGLNWTLSYRGGNGNDVTLVQDIAPVAPPDSLIIDEDQTWSIPTPGVLANDTDADGDTLTALLRAGPSHGALTLQANGAFIFTPNANYNGTDSFTYQANDGILNSATATAIIVVNPVNDPPLANSDSFSVFEDLTLSVPAAGVLAGDTDVDPGTGQAETLTAIQVTNPMHGTLTFNGDGSFTYLGNANFNGTDSFTYAANDGSLNSSTATVTITVIPVNDPPLAANDLFSVFEDQSLSVGAAGALTNDFDIDSPTLTALLVNPPLHGTLTLHADGSIAYTPAADYNGTDTFTYRANDGSLNSESATVAITVIPVNDPPVAGNDSYSVFEDQTLSVTAAGVLGNDNDIDSPGLTALPANTPAHGTITLNADGSFLYAPNAGYNGTDSFSYWANDGLLSSSVATVTFVVDSVNDAPVAGDDARNVFENQTLAISAPGILLNDSDIDSPSLAALFVTAPAHGTLTLNVNGSLTYTPNTNYSGTDGFTYVANDGLLNSNPATVSITVTSVNQAPAPNNDTSSLFEDFTLSKAAPGVLANDGDIDSPTLIAILVSGPAHGTLSFNANGAYIYVPATNYSGTDSFTYKANDGLLNSDVTTVTITVVPVNHPPAANSDSYSVFEDTSLNITSPGVLKNDTDIDGSSLTSILVTNPAHGTLTLRANGSFTYTPAPHYSGADSFTYRANDGAQNSTLATVSLNVLFVNHAPAANADTYNVNEESSLIITASSGVLANDADVENSPLSALLVTAPAHGTFALQSDGSFTYTPSSGYFGTDSFRYRANDGSLNSTTATVTLTVTDVSSLVSAIPSDLTDNSDGTFTGTITITNTTASTDIDGPLQIVLTNLTSGVTLQNKTGDTPAGHPYITIPTGSLSGGKLAHGQSVQVTVIFDDPLALSITYATKTLSGTI